MRDEGSPLESYLMLFRRADSAAAVAAAAAFVSIWTDATGWIYSRVEQSAVIMIVRFSVEEIKAEQLTGCYSLVV